MAYPVSSRWDKFIRRGFSPITRVDVQYPGQGIVYEDLPVSKGSISLKRGSDVRASGSIEIPDPTLFPALNDDSPIAPYGAELLIYTGTAYPEVVGRSKLSRQEMIDAGLIELVPMGVFVILDGSGSEKNGNVTTLEFQDRAFLIDGMEHVIPRDYGGASAFTTLNNIITDPDPLLSGQVTWTVNIDSNLTDLTLPRGTTFDTGRWDFIRKIAESLGAEVFFGRDGNVYVQEIPGVFDFNTEVDADWTIDAGEDGNLVDIDRSVSREETYNGVVVAGSADEGRPQPYAFVTDTDPNSRTQYGGPFGKVVRRFDDSNLTTVTQCTKAAKAKLRDGTGLQRTVTFKSFANPAMDPGDILYLKSVDAPGEIHLLDDYSYDFRTADISGNTRSVQFVEEL